MMSMASKAADELNDLQRFQDKAVGLVYNRCVQRGQIDARGVFRVMPHRLANGREWDVLAPGDGSPCMARYVGRQRYAQSQTFAQLFQLVIDKVGGILILPAGIHLHILDNRQQIGRAGGIIFIDNFLHRFLPFDEKLLPGLLATVGKYPVLQVLLFR